MVLHTSRYYMFARSGAAAFAVTALVVWGLSALGKEPALAAAISLPLALLAAALAAKA